MSDPSDGVGRYWLGLHKFTDSSVGGQLLNMLGHAGMGLALALPLGVLLHYTAPGLLWPVVPAGLLPTATREVVQLARTRSPHLLDRFRDTLEGGIGGAIAYGLVRLIW